MKKTWFESGVLVLALLLAVVASAAAVEPGTVTLGKAFNFDRNDRGFVRVLGTFSSAAPLNLGAAHIEATLKDLLLEDGGSELVDGLDPDVVIPARTRSARVTVFEKFDGTTLHRLIVRTCIPTLEGCPNSRGLDVGDYEFRIEVVNELVHSPTQCGPPPGPGLTEFTTRFTIDDKVSPPVEVLVEDWPATCVFLGARVILIRQP
jgi:hypothetical protein